MVVDTNNEVINALKLVLEQNLHFTISGEANDPISLLAQVAKRCPDVIILDADMQGINPSRKETRKSLQELIETIHHFCPSIRLITLSNQPYLEKKCFQAGANAFICKCDPPERLLSLLESLK